MASSVVVVKINHLGSRKAEEAQAAKQGPWPGGWEGGSVQLPKGPTLLGLGLGGAEELTF